MNMVFLFPRNVIRHEAMFANSQSNFQYADFSLPLFIEQREVVVERRLAVDSRQKLFEHFQRQTLVLFVADAHAKSAAHTRNDSQSVDCELQAQLILCVQTP